MVDARAGAAYEVEPDFASRQALTSAVMWLVLAVTMGLVLHLRTLLPGVAAGVEFLSYGRLRAVHDTVLVFGWLTVAGFAAAYSIIPRLTMAQLHNEVLGAASVVFWNIALFVGVGALLFGWNQGRPLAELVFPVDLALLVMMFFVLYNVALTAVHRRERTLYVAAWYVLAGVLLLPLVYLVGNLPVFTGMTDAIVSGFYLNAIEMLWLLPVGLAVAYYVVPVETGNQLASTVVARTGFWVLMFAGGWAGHRFYIKGPGPEYLESMAIGMVFVLLIPVLSAVSNLLATGQGRWGLLGHAYGLRFAVAGLGLALLWISLVVLGAVPQVHRLVGLTMWVSGVRHLATYGVFTAFAFALIYHVFPLMIGRDWWSRPAASFHFWATVGGVTVGSAVLLVAGVVQGASQQTWARVGDPELLGAAFQSQVVLLRGFQVVGALAFAVVAAAQYVFAVNAFRTSRKGPMLQLVQPPSAPAVAAR